MCSHLLQQQEESHTVCHHLDLHGFLCSNFTQRNLFYEKSKLFNSCKFVVQWLSHVQLFVTLWPAAHQASLSLTVPWSLPKFMSIEWVIPLNYLIFYPPLFLLPSSFLIQGSNLGFPHCRWTLFTVGATVEVLTRWKKTLILGK